MHTTDVLPVPGSPIKTLELSVRTHKLCRGSRIALGPPRQNPNGPTNFVVSSDNRVKFTGFSELREVGAVYSLVRTALVVNIRSC